MADEKQSLFKYFGRVPTNVCWNGASFPVMPGDVLKCYPSFIRGFINPKLYRELRPGEKGEPRHTFGRQPFFLRPDPTGGLPMRSDPNAGPRLKDKIRRWPAVTEDEPPENVYKVEEGGAQEVMPKVEAPKLEISTDPEQQPSAPVFEDSVSEESISIDEEEVVDIAAEEMAIATEDISEDIQEGPLFMPTKTDLRKMTVAELRVLAAELTRDGCPLKPEMLEAFEEFGEETTRGILFAAMWSYYGYDNEE